MDRDRARDMLEGERSRLMAVQEGFAEEHLTDMSEGDSVGELSAFGQHQADLGTETFERERDLSILERVQAELSEVEHAMRRLEEGTYGTCEACGRPIGDERLEAMPAARLCVDHQEVAEREARTGGSGAE